ncbi:MAG: type II secretion system GspH family protein [Actinomycetota bacterium]|nr:type II secretion system GspH family protein [Actinomycetota bacterium]
MKLRLHSEEGMTLTELMVAAAVLGVVLAIFFTVLVSMQTAFGRQAARSESVDQARLAAEELDREIRSGNVLYDPAAESDPQDGIYPGMSLRIYTQTNAGSRNPGFRCVQWRVFSDQLQRRDWAVAWRESPETLVGGWRIVADHILNRSVSPQVPAFTLDTSQATFGNRIVKIAIVANVTDSAAQPVEVDESITGRNTEFGYPNSVCADIPPY